MPQLDKVTFLSQFFWLCFFFLGFYYVILKFYLPKISRIIALRQKKLGFSQEGMHFLQQENQQVRENYGTLVEKALEISKSLFTNLFSHATNWLDSNASSINKMHYQNVNTSFLQSLGESSLSQNLLFYHASKNLPENLTFKVLIKNLETIKNKSSARKTEETKKTKKIKN
jgi:hypothetical protein